MVRIITDSAADFEPWELKELDIHCIPLTVIFGEKDNAASCATSPILPC